MIGLAFVRSGTGVCGFDCNYFTLGINCRNYYVYVERFLLHYFFSYFYIDIQREAILRDKKEEEKTISAQQETFTPVSSRRVGRLSRGRTTAKVASMLCKISCPALE